MIRRDYHMHTTYCDGGNSAEEMVLAAIDAGLEEVGISGHSHTAFDESYCMSFQETESYRQELLLLREKYRDQIRVKIGLEMDLYSDADTAGFDYIIGSVHYIRLPLGDGGEVPGAAACADKGAAADEMPGILRGADGIYVPVDETAEILRAAADRFFGGDMIALAGEYFAQAGTVAEITGCDIIGHFDLITKFNEKGDLFDEGDPRYIEAWKAAADRLLKFGIPFEINTGAMSKGYRTTPYPARPIREYIRSKGGRFILSSDSHRTDTLCYRFEDFESELK